jgi:metal-responsive CopG/Arc/MetJ family transcriptional regulator
MPKKVLIAFPKVMLEQIDYIATQEHRTRSDLVREAMRRYIENFKRVNSPIYSVNANTTTPYQPVESALICVK